MLGKRARDKVTGFEGLVTSRQEYLNGSPRVLITSDHLLNGGVNSVWFEEGRVEEARVEPRIGFGPGVSSPDEVRR